MDHLNFEQELLAFQEASFDVLWNEEQESRQQRAEGLLKGLNPPQKEAVLHEEGPLLILAGAGSGKTRVITHRIAHLILTGKVSASSVLAITFTNKAANEMKERLGHLLGEEETSKLWVGTFHSMFVRILRRHADLLGFPKSFTILDTDDQQRIIKALLQSKNYSDKTYVPKKILGRISSWKNRLLSPEQVERAMIQREHSYNSMEVYVEMYKLYQADLLQKAAMDFDDILSYTVKLFSEHPEVLSFYQEKFKQILVDEYQDTNGAQYILTKVLAAKHKNLCVVGDDDQSIYSFRGADITNILNFEKDYKDTKIIKLEQNYRSTSRILEAANVMIDKNQQRKSKKLWTAQGEGEKISVYAAKTQLSEADFVAKEIARLCSQGNVSYNDVAILYRMNVLSRNLEAKLRNYHIPCKIYGGLRFYERKVIKDMMAYLRFIHNTKDVLAFERIINLPARGIGEKAQTALMDFARQKNLDLLETCELVLSIGKGQGFERAKKGLTEFVEIIRNLQGLLKEDKGLSFSEFVEKVEEESGLLQSILDQVDKGKEELRSDIENLKELLTDAMEFATMPLSEVLDTEQEELAQAFGVEDQEGQSSLSQMLSAYLERATLYSSGDLDASQEESVKLMTIHSAKGLEFPYVFVVGMEEGIFPSGITQAKNAVDLKALEEERRLAYVAITRAMQKLYLSYAIERQIYGKTEYTSPSLFLREIPQALVNQQVEAGMSQYESQRTWKSSNTHASANASRSASASFGAGSVENRTVGFEKGNVNSLASQRYQESLREKQRLAQQGSYLQAGDLSVGMKVKHKVFGVGEVLQIEKLAGDALLRLKFGGEEKRLLAKSAKLERA